MRPTTLCLALVLAGCGGSPAPKKPDPAPEPAAKPAAAKPVDAKPISLDLTQHVKPAENAELFGYDNDRLFWYTGGVISVAVKIPADGEYQVVVSAACDEAQGQKAKFKLHVDGQAVGGETTLTSVESKDYTLSASLKAGDRKIGIEFTNDLFKEGEYDLNLYVGAITLKRTK